MSSKRKKYNPRKAQQIKVPVFAFLPIFGTLDIFITLLKRGYLNSTKYNANSQHFPHEYSLFAYLFHHTFIVSSLIKEKESKVMKYITSIRKTIENCAAKVMKEATEESENFILLPKQIAFTSLQIAKLIWFIENSKICFYKITREEFIEACKSAVLNQVLYLQAHPEYYLNFFYDKKSMLDSYDDYFSKL